MPVLATLTITMDDKGQVTVNGPLDNLVMCYGLLEIAKDTLRTRATEKARAVQLQSPTYADFIAFGAKK